MTRRRADVDVERGRYKRWEELLDGRRGQGRLGCLFLLLFLLLWLCRLALLLLLLLLLLLPFIFIFPDPFENRKRRDSIAKFFEREWVEHYTMLMKD